MKITIEIKDGLAGYRFVDGNNNIVHFENLERLEQIRILNGFATGYELFIRCLKEKEEKI